jgi:hypothetical protein
MITKDEERALADPALGKAFRLAMTNCARTQTEKLAFGIVAERMLRFLSEADLDNIESFAGMNLRDPFKRPEWLKDVPDLG